MKCRVPIYKPFSPYHQVHLLIVSPSGKAAKDPKSKFKSIRLNKDNKGLSTFQPSEFLVYIAVSPFLLSVVCGSASDAVFPLFHLLLKVFV